LLQADLGAARDFLAAEKSEATRSAWRAMSRTMARFLASDMRSAVALSSAALTSKGL